VKDLTEKELVFEILESPETVTLEDKLAPGDAGSTGPGG